MRVLYYMSLLLLDAFGTYTTYRIIQSFHIGYIKNKKIERLSYIIYHFIMLGICLIIKTPIIVFLINYILFFIISFNYKTPLKIRILSFTITHFLFASLEVIIVILVSSPVSNIIKIDSSSLIIFTIYRFLQLIFMLIILRINKKKNIKEKKKGDIYHIYIITSIICMIYLAFKVQTNEKTIAQLGFTVIAMLLILAVIMCLYTYFMNEIKEKNERMLLENTNYIRQYELLRNSSEPLSKLQHDLKNHVIYLKSIVGDNEEVKNYLDKMLTNAVSDNSYIDTGNLTIDSILNVKLFDAEQKGIKVEHRITIPIDLNVNEFDMTEILGNLMDDAIDKTLLSRKSKTIKLRIRFDRDRLFVWVFYPYAKSVNSTENSNPIPASYVSIIKAVEKYSGNIKYNLVNETREISIMLFIPKREELKAIND